MCVGGSYIGSEVAASLTELGKRVTVLMQEARIRSSAISGPRSAPTSGGCWRTTGSRSSAPTRSSASRRRRPGDDEGRVARVVTKGGRTPRRWRRLRRRSAAGRHARPQGGPRARRPSGVGCDSRLCTSATAFAAATSASTTASCTAASSASSTRRCAAQGATAARNMLRRRRPARRGPVLLLDLSDWAALEYVGPAEAWDEEVNRRARRGPFAVWYRRTAASARCCRSTAAATSTARAS